MTTLSPDDIKRMTPAERLTLIGDLWNSLGDTELPLLPAQRLELERRLESFDAEADRAMTWEQVKTKRVAHKS